MVCEISDLGLEGALAGRAGSELTAQALCGFTRYAGTPEAPCRVGYEIASVGAGMHAVQAMLAMALERERSGRGDYCHIAVLGQLLTLKAILLGAQSDPDAWLGFHLNGPHWPADTGWPAADGQVTFDFRHGEREGWVKLCQAIGLGHLPDDPDYADWRSTIYIGDRKASHGEPYRRVFRTMPAAEISALINGFGGISVRFHDYDELFAHPQLAHLAPFVEVRGDRQIGTPFRFEGGGPAVLRPDPAPRLGEAAAELRRPGTVHP
jgi:formyl-CoA transferase